MLGAGNNVGRGMNHSCGLPAGWRYPANGSWCWLSGDVLLLFLIPPIIIGSSNSSSAWAVCLFSLEYPRDALVIHHREMASFSSSLFSPRWLQGSQCTSTTWATRRLAWCAQSPRRGSVKTSVSNQIKWKDKQTDRQVKNTRGGGLANAMQCQKPSHMMAAHTMI